MNCWYTNATSLNNKMKLLDAHIFVDKPDIIFVCETWFTEDSLVNIANFRCFNRNRLEDEHGGVVIYVKDDLIAMETQNKFLNDSNIEQIWCSIDIGLDKILLGCMYRPPNSSNEVNKLINKSLVTAKQEIENGRYTTMIVAGDFNYPDICWERDGLIYLKKNSQMSIDFIDTINDNYIEQNVFEPTFQLDDGKSTNILDLILSDNSERIRDLTINPQLGDIKRAHYVLKWKFDVENIDKKFYDKKYFFKKGNYVYMNQDLSKVDWNNKFRDRTVNDCYDILLEIYHNLCDQYIPKYSKKEFSQNQNPATSKKEVKELIRKKRNLWKRNRASNFKYEQSVKDYKEICKKIKKVIKKTTCSFERELAKTAKTNPKLFYAYAKRNQKTVSKIHSIRNESDEIITERNEIVNILNNKFQSVFVKEDNNDLPEFNDRTKQQLEWDWDDKINKTRVEKLLANLNENKSTGSDGMSPYVLKKCSNG